MKKNEYVFRFDRYENDELPDIFLNDKGERISNSEEWKNQREYLKKLLEFYMFGKTPNPPQRVEGVRKYTQECCDGEGIYEFYQLKDERELQIEVKLLRPNKQGKFPIIIWNQFQDMEICPAEEEMIQLGYGVLSFNRNQFAPDNEGIQEFDSGAFGKAYPEYKEARAIAIWAWGCSYCASWLEQQLFTKELIVTGFSRGGKVAICAAAYDERFVVCAPVSSGMGGGGCFRFMGGRLGLGIEGTESLGYMLRTDRFWYWYREELAKYGNGESFAALGDENKLPFDLHTLRALIAPRAIICTEGLSDHLSDCYGTQVAWRAAQEAYNFLGSDGVNGLAFFEGGHEFTKERWQVILDFCEVLLKGKEQKRNYRRFEAKAVLPFNDKSYEIPALHFSWRAPNSN